jgi:phosphodiesterase/alkaline phosphatase D-like protein
LNATVNPLALAGSYSFAWGTSAAALSNSTAATPVAAGSGSIAAAANLTGLKPNTTYFFQVAITTLGGTATGSVQSFTTP